MNPLNQKSELTKHLQNITINRNRKEKERERMSTGTELAKTLEQRARRLEQVSYHSNSVKFSIKLGYKTRQIVSISNSSPRIVFSYSE